MGEEVDIGKAKSIVSILSVLVIGLMVVALVGYVGAATTVDEGDRKILKTHGEVTDVLEPGLTWGVFPVYHSTEEIEVRPQSYTMSGQVHEGDVAEEDAVAFRSADQQYVGVDVTVIYEVDKTKVSDYHIDWNNHGQFEERLLRPVTMSTVQQIGSGLDATVANSEQGRMEFQEELSGRLREEAPDSVTIRSVEVRDIHLDPEYEKSLEQVEVANQEAEAERQAAQGDADAERIRAEGDADAYEIRNEQITEEILALEQIEAYDDGTVFVVDPEQNSLIQVDRENMDDENWGEDDDEEDGGN